MERDFLQKGGISVEEKGEGAIRGPVSKLHLGKREGCLA